MAYRKILQKDIFNVSGLLCFLLVKEAYLTGVMKMKKLRVTELQFSGKLINLMTFISKVYNLPSASFR